MIRSRATFPDARGSRSGAVGSPRARRRGDFCLVSSAVKNCEPGTADFRRQRKACYSLLHELNIKKLYNNGSLLEIYPKLIFFA
jgi:hypothetical protein